jgi:hypothetical protein
MNPHPFYPVIHSGSARQMFVGSKVYLVVGGLTLDILHHEIRLHERTRLQVPGTPVPVERPDSMSGIVYGRGNIQLSRTEGFLMVDEEEKAFIPFGKFDALSDAEYAVHQPAEWKFAFAHTEPPSFPPEEK